LIEVKLKPQIVAALRCRTAMFDPSAKKSTARSIEPALRASARQTCSGECGIQYSRGHSYGTLAAASGQADNTGIAGCGLREEDGVRSCGGGAVGGAGAGIHTDIRKYDSSGEETLACCCRGCGGEIESDKPEDSKRHKCRDCSQDGWHIVTLNRRDIGTRLVVVNLEVCNKMATAPAPSAHLLAASTQLVGVGQISARFHARRFPGWPETGEKSLRQKTDFTGAFNPIGTIRRSGSKILLPFFRNMWLSSRIPLRQEGR
jgi:hypothetical protein